MASDSPLLSAPAEAVRVSDRVDLEIMTGVVGLLGGAMGVMREGEGRKGKIYHM